MKFLSVDHDGEAIDFMKMKGANDSTTRGQKDMGSLDFPELALSLK
jgi:hypothetical protein